MKVDIREVAKLAGALGLSVIEVGYRDIDSATGTQCGGSQSMTGIVTRRPC